MASKKFLQLGVQVIDGEVRTYNGFGRGRPLGPLRGARAEVSEAGSVKAGAALAHSLLSGPAGLFMGRRDSFAFISFANGELHEVKIQGKSNWRTAQQEAQRFNLMAGSAS
jgi:hypothetical protein